jgi:hypothetical protein
MIFLCVHRTRDFGISIEILEALAPRFFALDRANYARWIPIHIQDMKALPVNIREAFSDFWVLPKTRNKFSFMQLDQAHEENH